MIRKMLFVVSLGLLVACLVLWRQSMSRPISWDFSRAGRPVSTVPEFWQPITRRQHRGEQRWAYLLLADGTATVSYSDYDVAPFRLLGNRGRAMEDLAMRLRQRAEAPWYARHLGKDGLSFPGGLEFDEAHLQDVRSFREGSAQFLARRLERDSFLLRFSSTPHHQMIGRFPIWAPAVLCAAYTTIALIRGPIRRRRRRKKGLCVRCGYDLTGLPEPRCPECGQPFARPSP